MVKETLGWVRIDDCSMSGRTRPWALFAARVMDTKLHSDCSWAVVLIYTNLFFTLFAPREHYLVSMYF